MQEYSEGSWPLPDMMGTFPEGWSEIVQEILPTNDCDVCIPPLDIGPPPPLPANFQDKADRSGNCNICHLLLDMDTMPTQLSETSLLPILTTFFVGILLIMVTLVVLFVKVKKCRSFFPHVCWIFPRNLLPHTELSPSSLPSPSPSTEKLKVKSRPWNGSSHSIQSENIYEVCSPPSQESLYEEVGPPPPGKIDGALCSPYGIVLVNKDTGLVTPVTKGGTWGKSVLESTKAKPAYVRGTPVPHFSTFGGNGRGFYNPALREVAGNTGHFMFGTTVGVCPNKNVTRFTSTLDPNTMQKRKLPPVPADGINFSL